jgi:DNA polymerase (family 10)
MTQRMVRALEHPRVTMLAHPTGRLLLEREGYAVNLKRLIEAAASNGKMIELNANPRRLDLDWRYWRLAAQKGVQCVINPDAHEPAGLLHVRAGVRIARKGWLTREKVFNTGHLAEVIKALKIKR